MAGINRTVDTDTLTHLAQLADGWLNLMSSALRPMAIIEMLKDEHPEHAIEFVRSMCNSYCDQIKVAVARAQPISQKDPFTENAEFCATIRSENP